MEKYEINKYLLQFNQRINDIYMALRIEDIAPLITQLEEKMNDADFWNNPNEAQKTISTLNSLREKNALYYDTKKEFDNLDELALLAIDDEDASVMLEEEIHLFEKQLDKLEIAVILSGKYDSYNCILEIHPGAGGTESMDWADMLYRMYLRYCSKKGFKVAVLDYQNGDEAGIKSVTIGISGKYAYGYLKCERGVHRLVRISPFDANAKRHTSFASVDVSPQIEEANSIEINEDDLKIDVFRSSGAGGQSVNTTDSAVRITHKPTGIVVTCQNERSQIKNREVAIKVLKSKLLQLEIKKQEEELKNIAGTQMQIGFGSQIRSYVFHPYNLVKDHRTNYETGNISAVMDGDIDDFITAYLKQIARS